VELGSGPSAGAPWISPGHRALGGCFENRRL